MYLMLVSSASIGKKVFNVELNLVVIDCICCASFAIFVWYESDRGVVSTGRFQLVRESTGTDGYLHIVCFGCFAIWSLWDIAIE